MNNLTLNYDELGLIIKFLDIYDLKTILYVSKECNNITKQIMIERIYYLSRIKINDSSSLLKIFYAIELWQNTLLHKDNQIIFDYNVIYGCMILIKKGLTIFETNIQLNQKLDIRTYMLLYTLGLYISRDRYKNISKKHIDNIFKSYILQNKPDLLRKNKTTINRFKRYNRIICNIFSKNDLVQKEHNIKILNDILKN